MCIKSSERPSTEQALKHPWIKDLVDSKKRHKKEYDTAEKLFEGITLITEEEILDQTD